MDKAIEAGLALISRSRRRINEAMVESPPDMLARDIVRNDFGENWQTIIAFIDASRTLLIERDEAREKAIEECAEVARKWAALFGHLKPQFTSAQQWANDAVKDIEDTIRALKQPATTIVQDGPADDSR